jgi:hypothetical protein
MKLFLGTDEDEAEVFLNPNPTDGVGEFSMKFSGFGFSVMKRLVQVL